MLALLALTACYPPTTDHPVGTSVGLKTDPMLAGTWKAVPDGDDKQVGYYHFLSNKDGTFTLLLVPDKGGPTDVMTLKLTTARLGKAGFMNVRLLDGLTKDAKDQPSGSVPVLYYFDNPTTLRYTLLDDSLVAEAIKAHKIAGGPSAYDKNDVVITADGATLDKFFASPAGLALFKKQFLVMHKLN